MLAAPCTHTFLPPTGSAHEPLRPASPNTARPDLPCLPPDHSPSTFHLSLPRAHAIPSAPLALPSSVRAARVLPGQRHDDRLEELLGQRAHVAPEQLGLQLLPRLVNARQVLVVGMGAQEYGRCAKSHVWDARSTTMCGLEWPGPNPNLCAPVRAASPVGRNRNKGVRGGALRRAGLVKALIASQLGLCPAP